ncbi:MAG TPA: PHP domain-containing protein, partial [Candidatus Kapabacteria bacterium]|nr:PHP domain-containing protein [Candidatus Kapabacteria bacterium]
MTAHYAELHCFSNFSFLHGASRPEELVQQAVALNYSALAITDECSVAGVVRAHVEAKKLNLKLIIGSDFTSEEGLHFIVLAPDRRAYGQLTTLISRARRRSEKGEYCVRVADLQPVTDACLFIWLPAVTQCVQPNAHCANFMNSTRSRLWIGLHNNLGAADENTCLARMQFAQRLGLPL